MRDLSQSTGQIVLMTEEASPMTDNAGGTPQTGSDVNGAPFDERGALSAASPQQLLPLSGGIRAVPKAFSLSWWNAAVIAAWEYRKYTFKPALIVSITTFAYVGSLCFVRTIFAGHQDNAWMANEFIASVGISIVVLLAAIVISLVGVTWSIGLWFMVLTAFCRSFLSVNPETASRAELIESQKQAISHFRVNKRLILSTWLVYSILMSLPAMWLMIAFMVFAVASYPASVGSGPPPAQSLVLFCIITGSIASVLLTDHALLLFAYSSVSKKGGRAVAIDSLKGTLLSFPLITIVSSISLALSAVVIGVVGLLVFGQPNLVNFDGLMWLWILVLSAWHGVSSMVVLPLLMVVPCEMVRGSIE